MREGWIDDVAVSYLRYSSAPQEHGRSTGRQTGLLDDWLKRHPRVKLDSRLRLQDKKTSGYTGKHRTDLRYAMAQFRAAVEAGDVQPGTFLVVENLDRLSREHPIDSMRWILDLIASGIRIVQLSPWEQVYDADMDERELMDMLAELSRGHRESKLKGVRVGDFWEEKHRQARDGKPHGGAVPAWIELADGEYRLRPAAVEAIHTIFVLSAQGLGTLAIAERLRRSGVPPLGRTGRWVRSYVQKILRNRAVLGEYQPMKGHRPRVPDGEPIPDYFPAAVSEKEWYAARAAAKARESRCGRPTTHGAYVGPFTGLLRCALDGSKMHVMQRRKQRFYVSGRALEGDKASRLVAFPAEHFNAAVLSQLRELSAAELFADPGAAQVAELQAKLDRTRALRDEAMARFEADGGSRLWADKASEYDRAERSIAAELREANAAALNPLSATWAVAVEAMRHERPERLRQALLATVSEVWVLPVVREGCRVAAVQVWFAGLDAHRDYVIVSWPQRGGFVPLRPAYWKAASLASLEGTAVDLRDKGTALAVEKLLLRLDVTAV